MNGTDDVDSLPCLESLNEKYSTLEPWSVGISSGRRFDVQLRGLQELCEPCKDEAFSLLKSASLLFSRVWLNDEFRTKSTINYHTDQSKGDTVDSKPPEPKFSLTHRGVFSDTERTFHPILRDILWDSSDQNFMSISSFDKSSLWTAFNSSSRSNSFEVIKANQGSSDEDYISLKDSDSVSSTPVSIISFGSPGCAEYQTSNTERLPGAAKRLSEDAGSGLAKKGNPRLKSSSYLSDELDCGSPRIVSWEGGCLPLEEGNEQGSEEDLKEKHIKHSRPKEVTIRQMSTESSKSSSSSASGSKFLKKKIPTYLKSRSESKASIGSISSKSSVPSLPNLFQNPEASISSFRGITLAALRRTYSFLPHLIYSLMIGRPVVVCADRNNKQSVQSLLITLLPCVPSYPQDKSCVIMWTKGPLHISNLATVKLVGLAKSRSRGETVPQSILPYVSLLDFETATLTAPPYCGRILNVCFDPQKHWPSESVFLEYLHSALLEISTQAMIVFVWQFLGCSNTVALRANEIVRDENLTPYIVNFDVKRFLLTKFRQDDVNIINYLVKMIKDAFLCSYIKSIADDEDDENHGAFSCVDHTARLFHSETPSVKLNLLKCEIFTDVQQTKKK